MESKKAGKLPLALKHLEDAIKIYAKQKSKKEIYFLAVAKAFEIAVEYAWKEIKRVVEDEGLDAPSPKEAIRKAAKINLVEDSQQWIEYINIRNLGVHDYFGIPEKEYIGYSKRFLVEAKKLFK